MNESYKECYRKGLGAAIHGDYAASEGPAKRLLIRQPYYVCISEATTNDGGGADIATVNFKVTESFLEQIDDTWQGRGFNSRSEFIRYTLRDAVEFPTFDRDELVALLGAEEDIREGRTTGAEEAHGRFGTSDE
jgi:Arc/MetJ-type ribon-helix-helix transcriptional regulator